MSARAALATLLIALAFCAVLLGSLLAAGALGKCQTRRCWSRVHEHRRQHWLHMHRPWEYAWRHLPAAGRHWTRCVSTSESGNHRIARASGFLSYFQWTSSTWHATGAHGNPEFSASWYQQAVRAWHWHLSHPSGQWPNTGERGLCGS